MKPVLVLATSGRWLAAAARAAGFVVDVADLCGDQDCRTVARHLHLLPAASGARWMPDPAAVLACATDWAGRHPDGVLLPGSGFEGCPDVLDALAALLPMAGNCGAAVRAAKDPWHLAALCAAAGLHMPAILPAHPVPRCPPSAPPANRWLCKPLGGSGGLGVAWLAQGAPGQPTVQWPSAPPGHYLQAHQPGTPVSLLFFAHPETAAITPLAVHHQFVAPGPGLPFRFGGLVRMAAPAPALQDALQQAAGVLAPALGLRGLNGLDGLWDGARLWVLEINPRPPLSFVLQETADAARLLRAHIGDHATVPIETRPTGLNPGVALVYASRTLSIPADFRFPPGCHDVPELPHQCASGAPLCSVHVASGGIEELRARVRDLRECLLPVAGVESVSSL